MVSPLQKNRQPRRVARVYAEGGIRSQVLHPTSAHQGHIDQRFHEPSCVLAEAPHFARNWEQRKARFFAVRNAFIHECESAAAFPWEEAEQIHRLRKEMDNEAARLAASIRSFRKALARPHVKLWAPQRLAARIYQTFRDPPPPYWTGLSQAPTSKAFETCTVPAEDILKVLDQLADYSNQPRNRGGGHFQYGPVHFRAMPRDLPGPEVALGIKLADLFTLNRADEHRDRSTIGSGREPRVSRGTPWKALAQFVNATFATDISKDSLQICVNHQINENGARV